MLKINAKTLWLLAALSLGQVDNLSALTSGEMVGSVSSSAFKRQSAKKKLLGGDKDAHGCIATAGYIWCELLQTCVRPWELANYINQTYNPTPAWDSLAALATCKIGDWDISGFSQ